MTYEPHPIDTTEIRLPDEFLEIAELLAKNTHDVWAKARIAEGWTYGPLRDNREKKNPCLLPYEDLPDSEKEYDRQVSRQVLEVLYALGYRLVKDSESSPT